MPHPNLVLVSPRPALLPCGRWACTPGPWAGAGGTWAPGRLGPASPPAVQAVCTALTPSTQGPCLPHRFCPSPGGSFRLGAWGLQSSVPSSPAVPPQAEGCNGGPPREGWAVLAGQAWRLRPGPGQPCPSPPNSRCSAMPSPWGGGQRGAHRLDRWRRSHWAPQGAVVWEPAESRGGARPACSGPPTPSPAGSRPLPCPPGRHGPLPARLGQPGLGPRGTAPLRLPHRGGRVGSARVGALRSHSHERLRAQMAETCRPRGPGD